ncbi:Outer membrane lipoprotein pcp [Andreprevotia sp. IGB-42]|uniref:outer membrane lipoprotein n=1 Tax=Andreprevotia sp. IGB-42 TaxID=2497473 RepID=UPI00157F61BA|nr:hypothetical protein [Andreprevotia sp. IGB-42]KAF0814741.1 Outer membrane lipoprotein pcp [Andreprevotia sp. IGB-42]
MKHSSLIAAVLAGALMAGCASDSANVYSKDQMRRLATVQSGLVDNIRSVKMQNPTGIGAAAGGAIGGIAAGAHIGGGNGQIISGILGALLGGMIGNSIEKNVNSSDAFELTVRLNDGQRVVVVQEADVPFQLGQCVDVISDGQTSRVAPASRCDMAPTPSARKTNTVTSSSF